MKLQDAENQLGKVYVMYKQKWEISTKRTFMYSANLESVIILYMYICIISILTCWTHLAQDILVIMCWPNRLSPLRRHYSTWTNTELLTIGSWGKTSSKFESQCRYFCQKTQIIVYYDDVIKWKHFWSFLRGSIGHLWFPSQRPVARSFDVFFDLRLNKQLSKQSKRRC